jgi:hypothetical protein
MFGDVTNKKKWYVEMRQVSSGHRKQCHKILKDAIVDAQRANEPINNPKSKLNISDISPLLEPNKAPPSSSGESQGTP